MVQIKEGAGLSERNLYIVLSVCVIVSMIGSALMIGLTSQGGELSKIVQSAAEQAGFGSVGVGAVVIGTLGSNLLIWAGVLMIGLLSWAGRSFGLTAPRPKTTVVPGKTSVKLSVS